MTEKSQEEKIALTLGFTLEEYKHLTLLGKQNQIRKRVHELWRDYPGEYGARNVAISIDVTDGHTKIDLNEWGHSGDIRASYPFNADTESTAWEKALLWLADHLT